MVATRRRRVASRVFFGLYTAAVVSWLLLGVLPTLATGVPPVHSLVESLASTGGAFGRAMSRVLENDPDVPNVSLGQSLLQYGFSALNLVLGVILLVRRPESTVPRLLVVALLGTAVTFNEPSHRVFHVLGSPWPIAFVHFTMHVLSGVAYLWAVLLFPDGLLPRGLRLPRRWIPMVAAIFTLGVAAITWTSSFLAHPQFFVVFFGIAVPVVGVLAQLLKIRDPGTTPKERAVSRLLCAALIPALCVGIVWTAARLMVLPTGAGSTADRLSLLAQGLFPAVFALTPLVLSAAVVRYRLFDIDRLLSRLLLYGCIAGGVAVAEVVLVAVAGQWLGSGQGWTVIVLAAVAAAVEPLRAVAARWANKVVYGQQLSPAEALENLVDGLRMLTPADGLDQVVGITVHTTRATGAALYLREADRLQKLAAEPADNSWIETVQIPLPPIDGEADPSAADFAEMLAVTQCWPVRHHGSWLGMLAVRVPIDSDLRRSDLLLIGDVCDHAGLLLQNARLGADLSRQVAELADGTRRLEIARRNVVAAQDAERRRLERDLHDGAQQALVAGILGLRTAARNAAGGRNPASDLAAVDRMLQIGLGWLEDVISRDRPSLLADRGLLAALRSTADLVAAGGVRVRFDIDSEPDPESALGSSAGQDPAVVAAETAAFFCCSEALQNVTKYAGATEVVLQLARTPDLLEFTVADDGVGFDIDAAAPDVADRLGGLGQLGERCALLGGSLTVHSAPGSGTRVSGSIPLRPADLDEPDHIGGLPADRRAVVG